MSDKLKPCPFCGGKARISIDPEAVVDTQGRKWAYTVVCDRCAATSGLSFSTERISVAWNTRKPVEAVLGRLESVRNIELTQINGRCNGKTLKMGYLKGIANAIYIIKEGLT